PMIPDPNGAVNLNSTVKQVLEPLSKMTKGNKKQYIADVKVKNYLLQAIPNDIYNSVDACKNATEMWERIKRLMFGSNVTSHVRHLRLTDEFDKFTAKERESLESVYERLTTLVNIMDRNNVLPISVSINTKFLNYEYQGELQGDSQEDKLTTAMMLLARAITQKFSTPTNNHLHTSSNTRNQAVIQDGRVDIQTKNAVYGSTEETMEELTAAVMLMAQIQSADGNAKIVPSYDAKAASEVNASSKVHDQMRHEERKTIIQTSDDDQIDSNIIFDDPYVENTGGTSDHESNDHDEYHKIQMLAYDVQREAENQKRLNNELKKQKMLLQQELETFGLGYKNPERLKKAIAAQLKLYDGEKLHSTKLVIDSPDSEETLEDAEES
ncbi:hypothetical protein Tco_1220641, partial [Tanacetum coccineum]